ncbi:MAG: DUF4321 domain-containing protein [Oscillospiraceae bacterium]|nr:DUF4321 domain-containing protein [Oscillospiraceae bacterium]
MLFLLFMMAGAVVGLLVAEVTKDVSFLSWLGFGGQFGLGTEAPLTLDLILLRLQFGVTFHLSVAVIVCMALAGLLFRKFAR